MKTRRLSESALGRSSVVLWIATLTLSCEQQTVARAPATPPPLPQAIPSPAAAPSVRPFDYPEAPRGSTVDDYHGVKIADPYRVFEDPDAAETRAFVAAQNAVARKFLDAVPARDEIAARLEALWNYERYSVPSLFAGRLFYSRNDGLENQAVFYVQPATGGPPRMLIDPNAMSREGTVALGFTSPSADGRRVAYGLTAAGSDWTTIRVLDVDSGKDLPDELRWVKFSGAEWTRDGKGFFYSRFPEPVAGSPKDAPTYHQKLYFHRVGTSQAEDVLVFERTDEKTWTFQSSVSDDGRYLVVHVARSTDDRRRVFTADLAKWRRGTPLRLTELVQNFDAGYSFAGNDGASLYFRSNTGAARGRVVALNANTPGAEAKEIVAESPDALVSVRWVGKRLIATYLKDAHSEVRVLDTKGRLERTITLPGIGTARGFSGQQNDATTYFSFASFATPASIYEYSPGTGELRVFRTPRVAFEPEGYETRQVFATSKDGTRVPLFLTHKKGLTPDPSTPAYLYGYGGFNVPITPWFDVGSLVWMERGGVSAVAILRGGGEYGKAWHEAGMREQKQHVFDDFIAAAEWLVANRLTSSPRLAIAGRSNGGLLVGACITQRPELFGAALPAVGVHDMLRYHRFTVGWNWAEEYGSSDDAAMFRTLHAYSPLHNVRAGTRYPATLVTAADHDDRVVPSHSYKFAAALQAAQAGSAPILLRVETEAGHGGTTPTKKRIEEEADRLAFLVGVMH